MRVVAIYARVSRGKQSPELQFRKLRDYAARRGFVVHREYVDQASGDVRRRRCAPEFDALMADARRRRFDCVLVWKYDRFARSLGALIAALQEFRDLGIDLISHIQAIDTTTPMGRLFFHVIGSFAEFERDVIVERVRAGLANARAKGKRLGRPVRDPGAQARVRPTIADAAYPRLPTEPAPAELEAFTPEPAELASGRQRTRQSGPRLALLVLLKAFQRLGYVVRLADVPSAIIDDIATVASRLHFAFCELGRAVRIDFLLRCLSSTELRRAIGATTQKSELFNRYAQWVAFGSYEPDLGKPPAPPPYGLPDRLRPPSPATPSAVAGFR